MKDYYDILEVKPETSQEEIRNTVTTQVCGQLIKLLIINYLHQKNDFYEYNIV